MHRQRTQLLYSDVIGTWPALDERDTMHTMNSNKLLTRQPLARQLLTVVLGAAAILLVPLVAMQFTSEVNWDLFDFAIMGVLLVGIGATYVLCARMVQKTEHKVALGVGFAFLLLLIWAELAVGVFGSPFAGS